MEEMEEPKYVRALLPMESIFSVGCEQGILPTCYQATLRTRQPITSEEVLEALHWLYKKVPSLRLYLCKRDGEVWAAEMPEEKIDFEAYPSGTGSEMMQSLIETTFNPKGPLWKARLIKNANAAPCPSHNPAADYPFQSIFSIGIHHSITDGHSNIKIMDLFVQLLDKVIGKLPIDEKQLAVFHSGEEMKMLNQEIKNELLADQSYYNRVKTEVQQVNANVNTLWEDSIGFNVKDVPKTIFVEMSLNEENTANLFEKCKTYGVTVNSALCALVNIQIAETFREKGVVKDFYNIGSRHYVSLRRYWEKPDLPEFGLVLAPLNIFFNTPGNNKEQFWNYAKHVDKVLRTKIENKWPVIEDVVMSEISPMNEEEMEKFFCPDKPRVLHYCFTNLGNVDRMVQGMGNHVQWTDVKRVVTIHNLNLPIIFFIHTFRKRFNCLIACDSRFCSKELASRFVNIFEKKLLAL